MGIKIDFFIINIHLQTISKLIIVKIMKIEYKHKSHKTLGDIYTNFHRTFFLFLWIIIDVSISQPNNRTLEYFLDIVINMDESYLVPPSIK